MKLELTEFYKVLVRPTVVISTISPNGIANAAPFSWNSPMATRPRPLFGFTSDVQHDTWSNINANREFVVNMVGEDFGPLMAIMEKDLPYEISEIQECGLTSLPSHHIRPPRIKEAFGWLECKMTDSFAISDREIWIVGEILEAEVKDDAIKEVVDVEKVKPLNHIWGAAFVTEMKLIQFKRA
jgi:flavin reductase (DIM6/NTAB) family NADH-FMN oxidoreductase RutF